MDDRLEKALEHANYKSTLETQRKNLELRFQNSLLHSIDGGIFKASTELINFIDILVRDGHEDAVFVDMKQRPIHVQDLQKFYNDIKNVYFTAINEYYSEFSKLAKARNVKLALGMK